VRKLILSSLAIITAAAGLDAQPKTQEELKGLYERKQQAPWFTGGGWKTDFSAAKAEAKKSNKLIFAYFSRSYSP
jgi:hypothetical protein